MPRVFVYSQLYIAKKNDLTINEAINLSLGALASFLIMPIMDRVIGDSLFVEGS